MRKLTIVIFGLIVFIGITPVSIHAQGTTRTQHVEMTYIAADNYKNRLVNAEAGFNQLKAFFAQVDWKPGISYSFLKDVLGGGFKAKNGYVMTEKGYAYGACGASTILNKLVQT